MKIDSTGLPNFFSVVETKIVFIMKTTLNVILCFLFSQMNIFGQETNEFNRIHGEIKAPIIVVETINNDDFKYNQFDKIDTYADKKYQVHTSLHGIPITFYPSGKGFVGGKITKTDFYDIITNIYVSGRIDTESKLGSIEVTETITQMKEDYEVNFKAKYEYTGLKVNMGITNTKDQKKQTVFTFLVGKNTQLTVKKYINSEQSRSSKGTNTHTFEFIKIDEDKLEECRKSSFPCFNFSVYWDGKTSDDLMKESISITQLRGEDQTWEPPSKPYLRENLEAEPNSIGVYIDLNGLDEVSKTISHGMYALIIADLAKVPGLKILERGKIDKILEEIELSDSGLVKEDSKVENKLMKEEMAVIFRNDFEKKIITCSIQSKNKEIEIKSISYLPSEIFALQKYHSQLIIKEVNEQFKMKVDPNVIYNSPFQ